MGFSSGASAAKREAKKAEARYYNEYFTAVRQTGQLKTVDSLDVDGVPTIPKRYNEAVTKYNKRVADLDRQMRGETLTERVSEVQGTIRNSLVERLKKEDSRQSVLGGGIRGLQDLNSQQNTGWGKLAGMTMDNTPEGRADRILKGGLVGGTGWSALATAGYMKEVQEYSMAAQKYGRVTGSYRDNVANKAAFDELNALSAEVNEARKADKLDKLLGNNANNSPGTQQGDLLAQQKRKARASQGLRSTILAGGQAGAAQGARKTVLGGA